MESRDVEFTVVGDDYHWACPNCGLKHHLPIRWRWAMTVQVWDGFREYPSMPGGAPEWTKSEDINKDPAEIPPCLVCVDGCDRRWYLDDPTDKLLVARYTWSDRLSLLRDL